ILLIFGFLYMSMKSTAKSFITMSSIPLAAIGAILFIWIMGFNMSIAIWVGVIALMGVSVQDTMVMIVFLDEAWGERRKDGKLNNLEDCFAATKEGAQKSLRSILMDLFTDFIGFIPVMMATGLGADVMKRLSAPMFGGLFFLMIFILLVIPVVYFLWEGRMVIKGTYSERS
ncbi:MAG: efflux RND transporter permease subunit, partial [Bacteriovoracaceae bacterium]|nr:efflux RND transporter permease subunit [Bacteriovoracaceae bacterium]